MHILLVHQYFLGQGSKHGGGSRWNQMSRYFAQDGHKVTVLAGTINYMEGEKGAQYKGKFIVKEQPYPGVTVYRCHVSDSYNKSFLGRFWAYLSFAISTLYASLRIRRPDVMICTSPPLTVGLTGFLVRRRFRKLPMIFEVRDLWPESAIDTGVLTNPRLIRLGYALERLCYRESTWINVLTPAFERILIEKKDIREDRISMLPNAADLDIFQPGPRDNWVREKYNIGDRFVAIYTGGLGVANHVIQFVEAARHFDDDSARFLIVGGGMHREMLEEKVAEWGLQDVVIFTGFRPKTEVVDICAAADVCCAVLKKIDTFKTVYPNKVFDYMAASRPAVVAIDGMARKLVEDAQCGCYVEPENSEELAETLKKLQADPDLRRRMGENGLAFVRENFDRKKISDRYIDTIINKVLPDGGACAVKS